MDSAVRAELALILASEPFRNADSARRFLTFVVEEKLAGRIGSIKELVIGREVFARGGDFDPRIDPVARIQAGKLRTRLKEYYDGPGMDAPLVIDMPKGTYVPEFRYQTRSSGPEISLRRPIRRILLTGAAAVACVASGYWLGRSDRHVGSAGTYQLSVPLPAGFTGVGWPVISPDGRTLVFSGRRDGDVSRLWLVDLTSEALRPVPGTESGSYPFWSPDSRSIGFADLDKRVLQKVPKEGERRSGL